MRLIVIESEDRTDPVPDKVGIDESEWSDSPEEIEEWCRWLRTIEPVEFAEPDDFTRQVEELSREAVRRVIEGNEP